MYTKPTLQDALLSLSYRYGESSVPAAGIDNRKQWVNNGVEFIVTKLKLTKSVTVTIVNGECSLNASTASPAYDFKSFAKLVDGNGYEFNMVDTSDFEKSSFRTGRICSIYGNFATGYTLKCSEDGDMTLWYQFYTEPMVSLTDTCIVPDIEAVSAYAYAQIRMSETDPLEDADKNMEECLRRIGEMNENVASNEAPLNFKPLF